MTDATAITAGPWGGNLTRRGHEHVGPCPLCGGTDRFRVKPDGRFFCRQCLPDGKDTETLIAMKKALGVYEERERDPEWDRARARARKRPDPITIDIGNARMEGRIGPEPPSLDKAALKLFEAVQKATNGQPEEGARLIREMLPAFRERVEEAAPPEEQAALTKFIQRLESNPEAAHEYVIKLARAAIEPKYHVMSWAELKAVPALRWLVEDLLPRGGFSILAGDPKAGKSTLMRVLMATMAEGGGPWLGRQVEPGRVIYVALDEHPAMVRDHLIKIASDHALTAVDFVFEPVQLDDLAEVAEGRDLVVVDTLGQLSSGHVEDGDGYMDWQDIMRAVRTAANQSDAHFLVLHHARKAGGTTIASVLGSQAIAGAVDTVILITMEEDADTGEKVRYVQSSNRAGRDVEKQKLTIDGDGWVAAKPVRAGPQTVYEQVVQLAQRMGDQGIVKRIARAELKGSNMQVDSMFDLLVEEGRLVRMGRRYQWNERVTP